MKSLRNRERVVKWGGCLSSVVLLVSFLLLRSYMGKSDETNIYVNNKSTTIWHTKAANEEVIVPFSIVQGLICVKAEVSGRKISCIVDTGSQSVFFGHTLHLANRDTGIRSRIEDAWNNGVSSKWVILSNLRLGSYEMTNIPAEEIAGDTPVVSSYSNLLKDMPVIGNSFFRDVQLTINFQKHELTIRRSNTHNSTKKNDKYWMDMLDDNDPIRDSPGRVAFAGTITGRKMKFMLDTGCIPAMVINKKVALNLPANTRYGVTDSIPSLFGQNSKRTIAYCVPFSIGMIHGDADVLIYQNFAPDTVVGIPILQCFCITIDYANRRVQLVPAWRGKGATVLPKNSIKLPNK